MQQRCSLYPVVFNIFLEKIKQRAMTPQHPLENDCFAYEAVEDGASVSIGGWPLCNLRFTDDIDLLGGTEEEQLIERLEKTAAGCGVEINSNKGKILLNCIKPRPSTNIWTNGKTLEEVEQFKYLGSTHNKDNISIKEVESRLVQAQSAITRLSALRKN